MSTKRPPAYRFHKARGLAVVTLSGKDFYLGPHGSDESWAKYHQLLQEWYANGRSRPPRLDATAEPELRPSEEESLVELLADYWDWTQQYYRKNGQPTGAQYGIKVAVQLLHERFGRIRVSQFGPKALKSIRKTLINKGLSRRYINDTCQRIKAVFKWGVAEERIAAEQYHRLQAVCGLKRGRSQARETGTVLPVSRGVVEATLAYLSPVVADLVRFQLATACRPGEAVLVRPGDVDRSGEIWVYTPHRHKTEHHGRRRVVALGPIAQDALAKYLLRDEDEYCFSPAEAVAWRYSHDSTRRWVGGRPPGVKYTVTSYNRAIKRACQMNNIDPWSPNQLRHLAATQIRHEFGLEAAQVVLGHCSADVTQIYAEANINRAVNVARQLG